MGNKQKFQADTPVKHKDGWEGTIVMFVPAGMMKSSDKNRYIVNRPDVHPGKVWADEDDLEEIK